MAPSLMEGDRGGGAALIPTPSQPPFDSLREREQIEAQVMVRCKFCGTFPSPPVLKCASFVGCASTGR